MSKNTSIVLGDHFEAFVRSRITEGRFSNASEVIRAALRLLEEEEYKYQVLRTAIQEGMDSGVVEDFDPNQHLKTLKSGRSLNA